MTLPLTLPLFELGIGPLIALNTAAWLALHLLLAWGMTKLPLRFFTGGEWWARGFRWERDGELWNRLFKVKRWKRHLPDGAALFRGGFRKATLTGRDPAYLATFLRETSRSELVHWLVLACVPLFLLWNPPWAMALHVLYALVANGPCILAQRVNRPWLRRVLRS